MTEYSPDYPPPPPGGDPWLRSRGILPPSGYSPPAPNGYPPAAPNGYPPPAPNGYPPPAPNGYPPPMGGYPQRSVPDYPPPPPDYPPPPPDYPPLPPSEPSYGQTPEGWGYPPADGGLNKMAVASLVCSVLGWLLCGIGPFFGVLFGFLALRRIGQSGERGRGLAIAGLIIGALAIVIEMVSVQNGTASRLFSSPPSAVITVEQHPVSLLA